VRKERCPRIAARDAAPMSAAAEHRRRVRVLFTVDVEVWCDGWTDLDRVFPTCFRQYIYGQTSSGRMALPFTLQLLGEHGLRGVFFVESLFAARFGIGPLSEIVGLIQAAGQEVQLHLHPEWASEVGDAVLSDPGTRRWFLRDFTPEEQATLVACAAHLLGAAGVERISAFRAGSYGMNDATLDALAHAGIGIDTSYNFAEFLKPFHRYPAEARFVPYVARGVTEVPVSYFRDGFGRVRHMQLGACGSLEMESVLWQAADRGLEAVVIVSHGFELLNRARTRADPIAVARFRRLCRFLDRHRDVFESAGFAGASFQTGVAQPPDMAVSRIATGRRVAEQVVRRVWG
jgi:hypothetical protein